MMKAAAGMKPTTPAKSTAFMKAAAHTASTRVASASTAHECKVRVASRIRRRRRVCHR